MTDTVTIVSLPRQLTPLIGRQNELAAILNLIRDGQHLITITGIGGMGKTRLAHQVALEIEPELTNGAIFVPLADIREANQIPQEIARLLGSSSGDVDCDGAATLIGAEPRLLVLDNLEHLPAAGDVVTTFLQRLPNLSVLCTSQIPLDIDGEQLFPLDPMKIPEEGDSAEGPAIELFVQRAKAANPHQQCGDAELPVVAEICRMLDGIPLAIELAAGRTSIFSLPELRNQLDHRLDVLAGGKRTAPERQRTMRNALTWSYDLLDENEQRLFRYLGVFAGGISLDAVEHTLQTLEITESALDSAEFFISRGLLRRLASTPETPRFQMLRIMRDFGQEQRSDAGDDLGAKLSHATWITHLAEEAETNLSGSQQFVWHQRMAAELDNIHAACDWAAERRPDLTLRIISALIRLFESQGNMHTYRDLARRALAQEEVACGSARGWMALGTLEMRLREDSDSAESYLNKAIEQSRIIDDRQTQTRALIAMGTNYLYRLDFDSAETNYKHAETLAREVGLLDWCGGAILNQGLVEFFRGNFDIARDLALRSLDTIERSEDLMQLTRANINLGIIYLRLEEPLIARDYLQRAVTTSRSIGSVTNLIQALGALGNAHMELGDTTAARSAYDETILLTQQTHHRVDELEARTTAMVIPVQEKDWPTAARDLFVALSIDTGAEGVRATCACAGVAMLLALENGDQETAAALWGGTTALAELTNFRSMEIVRSAGEELLRSFGDDESSISRKAYERGRKWTKQEVQHAASQVAHDFPQKLPLKNRQPTRLEVPLTTREQEVLSMMAQGRTNAEIAEEMYISLRTITTHASNIFSKLEVKNRSSAVAVAQQAGLLANA